MKNKFAVLAPIFACALCTFGLTEMFFKTIEHESFWYITLLWSLLFSLTLYFIFFNRKTTLIVLISIACVLPVIWLFMETENRKIVIEFITICRQYLFSDGEISLQYANILSAVFVFVFSLIVILPTLIFPFFPVIFVICIGSITAQWGYGNVEILFESCIVIGALIILFAHSNNKTSKLKRHLGNYIALWLIPASTIVMLIVGGMLKNSDYDRKWYWLETRTNIIGDYISEYTGNISSRYVFSIKSMGFNPLDGRLGGPIKPKSTEIMYVNTKYPLLLRGSVKNLYTGNNWTDDIESYRYRFNRKNEEIQKDIFSLNLPGKDTYSSVHHKDVIIQIMPIADGSSTIFVPFRTVKINPNKILTMIPSFNTEGEVFSSRDIKSLIGYEIEANLLMYNGYNFEIYVKSAQADSVIESTQTAVVDAFYTQIPEELPQSVINTALDITSDITNDYLKASALKQYFEKDFRYILNPVIPPEDMDFIEHFLTTKEGYCTYFATAITVMSRCVGLPSRYVEGFKVIPDNKSSNSQTVTAENAHAWAEVYIENIGWIPFDPAAATSNQTGITNDNMIPEEDFLPEATPDVNIPVELQDTGINIKAIITAAIILLLIVILLLTLIFISKIRVNFSFVKRKYKSNNDIFIFYYKDILQILKYYNYEKPKGHTINTYAKNVDSWLNLNKYDFKQISDIINKMVYARQKLTDDDAFYINNYHNALCRYTGSKRKYLFYIIMRIRLLFASFLSYLSFLRLK